ncbi:HEX-like protein [Mya arenaria]|uniref:beta-N-acetylhexosaminidase n=1 Tax=Mya arenaria TaxID=6604 RepID=A0ABY7F443_MYAAR|nr:HEX-like protein [Mya arenaria]
MRNLFWMVIIVLQDEYLTANLTQNEVDEMASGLKVRIGGIDNLRYDGKKHIMKLTLENKGSSDIPPSGWKLFFHSMTLGFPDKFDLLEEDFKRLHAENVVVGIVNGDLYYLKPFNDFVAIKPGEGRTYQLIFKYWSAARTDYMPLWYVASEDLTVEPRIVKSTASMDLDFVDPFDDINEWKRWRKDRFNPFTPEERMNRLQFKDYGKMSHIIPTPKTVILGQSGRTLSFDKTWTLFTEASTFQTSELYIQELFHLTSTSKPSPKNLIIHYNASLGPESYTLAIDAFEDQITMAASTNTGLFYATQSLFAILDGHNYTNIPSISISDAPRFEWRGLLFDVARNFRPVEDIKRLIKVMSMYKLNALQLHLSDDEGWRLEIPGIPELTDVGGRRCHHDFGSHTCIEPQFGSGPFANSSGSGFYTTKDYREILRYAEKHHVKIIPEFDVPGHSHAAIVAMEKRRENILNEGRTLLEADKYRLIDPGDNSSYRSIQNWAFNTVNPCMSSVYTFISDLLDSLIELHKGVQQLEIFHPGGDEVPKRAWDKSPICNQLLSILPEYDTIHVAGIVASKGLALGGREDSFLKGNSMSELLPVSTISNVDAFIFPWNNVWEWGGKNYPYIYANAGYKVILSQATDLYLDQPQEPDPEERGLYWATRFTDTKKMFKFKPDTLYDNIFEDLSGNRLTEAGVCKDVTICPPLKKPHNVIGIQGSLWSETLRRREDMEYMTYPRLLAIAERAWHKADFENHPNDQQAFEKEWSFFAKAVGTREFKRLDDIGIQFRIPPPGAKRLDNGHLQVSTTYPGFGIEISINKGLSWAAVGEDVINNANKGVLLPEGATNWTTLLLRSTFRNANRIRYSRSVILRKENTRFSSQQIVDYIAENLQVKIAVVDNLEKDADEFVLMELQKYWMVSRTDNMPNWYVSAEGMKAKVLKSTVGESLSYVGKFDTSMKWKRSKQDRYNPYTPLERFTLLQRGSSSNNPNKLIPTPKKVLSGNISMAFDDIEWKIVRNRLFSKEVKFIAESLHINRVANPKSFRKTIRFEKTHGNIGGREAYQLLVDVHTESIVITAQDNPGAFYGVVSLVSLIEANGGRILNISTKEWIMKLMDVMSWYKLNKLQLHLSDDEGWRIKIRDRFLPDMVTKRCHTEYEDECLIPQLGSGPDTDTSGSGFYTERDYRDILNYASKRHIEVIPEIDIPCHSAAAVRAMSWKSKLNEQRNEHGRGTSRDFSLTDGVYNASIYSVQMWKNNCMNPCLNSTYRTAELHKLFIERVAKILAKYRVKLAVSEDGAYANGKPNPLTTIKQEVYVHSRKNMWNTDGAKKPSEFADAGYKVILELVTHLYWDFPQEPDPEDRGLYWGTRFTDTRKVFNLMPDDIYANADVDPMGVPVNLTAICHNRPCPQPQKTENIVETMRTEEHLHNMAFPRMLALAERAWHHADWEQNKDDKSRRDEQQHDWEAFADALGYRELPRLEKVGVFYLVEPPGIRVVNNILEVNTRFPNHVVEMSLDGGQSWRAFQKRTRSDSAGNFMFRTRSPVLGRTSRVVTLNGTSPGHGRRTGVDGTTRTSKTTEQISAAESTTYRSITTGGGSEVGNLTVHRLPSFLTRYADRWRSLGWTVVHCGGGVCSVLL